MLTDCDDMNSILEFEDLVVSDLSTSTENAHVTFPNTAETYPVDADLNCCFLISCNMTPRSDDWIGLYRVGWVTPKDYIVYCYSPFVKADLKNGVAYEGKVTFQHSSLPKEEGEFFQFCYVTASGHVKGASLPFQFKHPSSEVFVQVEDEDMIFIKSKTSALQEDLNTALHDKQRLLMDLESVQKTRDELVLKLDKLTIDHQEKSLELIQAEGNINEKSQKIIHLENENVRILEARGNLVKEISLLNQETKDQQEKIMQLEDVIDDLKVCIRRIENEKDSLNGIVNGLEQEKELFKNHFSASESTVVAYLEEINSLKLKLPERDSTVKKLTDELSLVKSEVDQCKIRSQNDATKLQQNHQTISNLKERIRNSEDKLSASELCKRMLNEEVNSLTAVYQKASQDLETSRSECFNKKMEIIKHEEIHKKQVLKLNQELSSLKHKVKQREEEKVLYQMKQKEEPHVKKSELTLKEQALALQKSAPNSQPNKSVQAKPSASGSPAGTEASMLALHSVNKHLKEKIAQMKKKYQKSDSKLLLSIQKMTSAEQLNKTLEAEVADLKLRLGIGADEYKKKYLECEKLERELKKFKKTHPKQASNEDEKCKIEYKTATTQTEQAVKPKETENKQTENSSEVGSADLTCAELRSQLADLGKELEQRLNKKKKYKQLYAEEKERNIALRNEICQRDLQVKALTKSTEKSNEIEKLKEMIQEQKNELENIKTSTFPKVKPPVPIRTGTLPRPTNYPGHAITVTPSCPSTSTLNNSEERDSESATLPEPIEPQILPEGRIAAINYINNPGATDSLFEDIYLTVSANNKTEKNSSQTAPRSKICPVCSIEFPDNSPDSVFSDHCMSHFGPECPMCKMRFEDDFDQAQFELHVQGHFDT